jgi:hypothetical protein
MARHDRRRWALLFRCGAMTEEANARQNTRTRDRLRFSTAQQAVVFPTSRSSLTPHGRVPNIPGNRFDPSWPVLKIAVAKFEFAASLNRSVDDDGHKMKQDCSLKQWLATSRRQGR